MATTCSSGADRIGQRCKADRDDAGTLTGTLAGTLAGTPASMLAAMTHPNPVSAGVTVGATARRIVHRVLIVCASSNCPCRLRGCWQ